MQSLDNVWQQVSREFEAAQQRAASEASWRLTDELNQLARRLKQYSSEDDWYAAILDGASRFSRQAAVFSIAGRTLTVRGARGVELPSGLQIESDHANAFAGAIASPDPTIVLCTNTEVSQPIATAVGTTRALVLAISNESRKVGLLFATLDEKSDVNALELICQIASSALRRIPDGLAQLQVSPAGAPPKSETAQRPSSQLPAWANLPSDEKLMHIRAQRMARSKVAQMALYKPEACKTGAAQRDLYLFLKKEIDGAREAFRNQFMSTKSMVDYLHCELLQQLAANDESLLGADYPGQMA